MHACIHAYSNRTVHLTGQLRLAVQCTTAPYVHYTSILLTLPTILYTFSFLLYVHTSSMLHTFPSLLSTYLLPSNLLTLRSTLFPFPHILPAHFLLYCTRFPLYSLLVTSVQYSLHSILSSDFLLCYLNTSFCTL
jgi:hypothetical protein